MSTILAELNYPTICAVHGVGGEVNLRFLSAQA